MHNRFLHADRSINSVLNQSYKNWELFIVDDASLEPYILPSECKSVLKNITLLRNITNLGPGLSRQKGLDLAKGDYVCFLDSDDYWKPEFLSESVKVHESNPHLAATYCQSEMTDGTIRRRNNVEDAVDDIFYGVVSGVRPWATCAILWKRQYLAKWNSIRTNQDALFELETSMNNPRILMVPKILCVIDKESGSNSEDLVKKAQIEKNRSEVLRFAVRNCHLYKGINNDPIKRAIWERLRVLTVKQFKYKNYFEGILNIILLIKRLNWAFYKIEE